ncbi:ScbR family autoregulator-binding transcription factor [Streptomyces chryseus]|uniref:TetR family transcriptional regulator n=1 Tax=Streptomyces chryseus TaxID=68186 RepID=A0ABQ3DGK6_9ACTN|nr:ScbR family autoregulator-binding transcription factor [Streptomyces chryseus]GGX36917.1 TetR family transcriptional regulator [Streptomyces chryseus]GHA88443.1 TetR family transcriptional regulator [Streptomyces chryseus]
MARQERAEVTRSAIIDGAARAFDHGGFSGTSLSDIVKEAGVTKGALYFHFASKEDLAQAVIDEQFSIWDTMRDIDRPGVQTVIDLVHGMARQLQESVRVRAGIRLVIEQSNVSGVSAEPYAKWIELIRNCLAQAQGRGDVRPEVDVDHAANLIVGCWTGLQLSSQVLAGRRDLSERTTQMWQMLLPGLVPVRRLGRFVVTGGEQSALEDRTVPLSA